MTDWPTNPRQHAAAVARALYRDEIDFATFCGEIGPLAKRDPEIADLLDEVTHEPAGDPSWVDPIRAEIFKLIDRLEGTQS